MWKELSMPWRIAFEEAWDAFRGGCTPIGAALYDSEGKLLIRERNRGADADTVNRRISHAEANILRRLDTDARNDLNSLVLYTTMEPCPMCRGTCVMSGIRHLRFAARDPYCGFTHLADTEPYFISKHLDFTQAGGEAEFVQITVQSVYELGYIAAGNSDKVLRDFRAMLPEAVATAEYVFREGLHKKWQEESKAAADVFDEILKTAERNK